MKDLSYLKKEAAMVRKNAQSGLNDLHNHAENRFAKCSLWVSINNRILALVIGTNVFAVAIGVIIGAKWLSYIF